MLMIAVLHRIDDLEIYRLDASNCLYVLHRIDDLEKASQRLFMLLIVLHRIDDLENVICLQLVVVRFFIA